MLVFRPFDPDKDYELLAELWNKDNPDFRRTAQELRDEVSVRPPDMPLERWVAEIGGKPVCAYGYGDQLWAREPGRRIIFHWEDPAFASQAIGIALHRGEAMAAADGSNELNIWTREDRPLAIEAIEAKGYAVVERQPVTRFDLSRFTGRGLSDRIEGLRFASIAELEKEGFAWMERLYGAVCEIVLDIPSHHEQSVPTLETYRGWLEDEDKYKRSSMFVALDGDQIVAYSGAQPSKADPALAVTGLSGTIRTHRRRGIVTALKAHALKELKKLGFTIVQTDNLDHNPMFEINRRLGFTPAWTWLHYLKKL